MMGSVDEDLDSVEIEIEDKIVFDDLVHVHSKH